MEQISVQHNVYRMNHRNNLVFLLILFLLLGNRLYYRNKKKKKHFPVISDSHILFI